MLKNNIILSFITLLSFVSLEASAIQIRVKAIDKPISALGFTVNGQTFGGLGSSYEKEDAPQGLYAFGVRAGKDIPCKLKDGTNKVRLQKNTTALLNFDGKHCRLKLI